MYQVKGVVDRAFTKTKQTSKGDKIINYIDVDGVEISTGFKADHQTGEMINISVDKKFGEIQKVGNNGEGQSPVSQLLSAPAAVKGNFGGGGGGWKGGAKGKFPVEPTDGQMSIIRQSSMNRAVEIVRDMMESDIFNPKTEQEYLTKLIEVALFVTDFGSGQDQVKLKAAFAERYAQQEAG
jgi:hypothetical protein